MVRALHDGACPDLRCLNLRLTEAGMGISLLGDAFRAGAMPRLERLSISQNDNVDDMAIKSLIGALKQGSCRQLEWLQVSGVNLTASSARALGEAMQYGALPRLRHLDASWNIDVRNEGMIPILSAMMDGKAPYLQALDISSTSLGLESLTILFDAMKGGALTLLLELLMGENYLGEEGMVQLAEVVEKGAGEGKEEEARITKPIRRFDMMLFVVVVVMYRSVHYGVIPV